VRTPPRVLIADDNAANLRIMRTRLTADGYEVVTAADGEEALAAARDATPDLILLDIMMPKVDGIEVCRRLKERQNPMFVPIILVTAMADLAARVRSMLRIKALHDTVAAQADEIARWNTTLEKRVAEQVAELERVSRLKRFFSPQLADAIVAGGAEDPLRPHRREISVVFLDLRGFTAFAETSEPEEVSEVLEAYHAEVGRLILEHEGTLERFTGDGMMIFFNDPVPVANPEERALRMADAMRARIRNGADEATTWISAWASRRAMRRSARLGSKAVETTPPSVASPIWRFDYVPKPRRDRSWSVSGSTPRCQISSTPRKSAHCSSRASIGRSSPMRSFT